MNEIVCSVDGCERTVKSKGLCTTHYHRMYRHGRTDKPKWMILNYWKTQLNI